MMSNYNGNKRAVDAFRKELKAMLGDISEIDVRVLNHAVGQTGLANAKRNTPVISGFMRRSWRATPVVKSLKGAEKSLINTADYSSYVNDGHRIVTVKGIIKGWVKGQFILERANHSVDLALVREFNKEIERVNKKHDK